MSYHVFFAFSTGLTGPIQAPKGTLQSWLDHVEQIEETLNLKREQYHGNPVHWDSRKRFEGVSDETLCEEVEEHNAMVRRLYADIETWSRQPPENAETITPEDAAKFWHALEILTVPPARWTRDYYRTRMDYAYSVMRGVPSEGVDFGAKALNQKQAAAVINLFAEYLDAHDMRLDVPKGRDYLASSYDGGYEWCEKCGAVTLDDGNACTKRKCPIREEDES